MGEVVEILEGITDGAGEADILRYWFTTDTILIGVHVGGGHDEEATGMTDDQGEKVVSLRAYELVARARRGVWSDRGGTEHSKYLLVDGERLTKVYRDKIMMIDDVGVFKLEHTRPKG